jgi:hypothetical protein
VVAQEAQEAHRQLPDHLLSTQEAAAAVRLLELAEQLDPAAVVRVVPALAVARPGNLALAAAAAAAGLTQRRPAVPAAPASSSFVIRSNP